MDSHWDNYSEIWKQVKSPLRPSSEDIVIYNSLITAAFSSPVKVLLLGVTREIADMRWPDSTELAAMEMSPPMINNIWRPSLYPCINSNWLNMPIKSNSIDIVIGDGCYTTLGNPALYHKLNLEICRVLKKNGKFIQRFFLAPEKKEGIEHVTKTPNVSFHAFKWRLMMTLQQSFARGIALNDAWLGWSDLINSNSLLSTRWDPRCIETINVYKDIESRYTFPTLRELRNVMGGYFKEVSINHGSYELSERCPIICYTQSV